VPWITLSAQALLSLRVIPLGTLMVRIFSDLGGETAVFKSTPVSPKAWSEIEATNISGQEIWLWAD